MADTSSDNASVANVVTYIDGTLPATTDNSSPADLNEDNKMDILMVDRVAGAVNDIEYNTAISELHYALMSSEINYQPSDISSEDMLKSDLESTDYFLSSVA